MSDFSTKIARFLTQKREKPLKKRLVTAFFAGTAFALIKPDMSLVMAFKVKLVKKALR